MGLIDYAVNHYGVLTQLKNYIIYRYDKVWYHTKYDEYGWCALSDIKNLDGTGIVGPRTIMNNETDPRIQKLIDICYQLTLTASDKDYFNAFFKNMSIEDRAEWVRTQLNVCGFPTKPCGSSWGVLTMSNEKKFKIMLWDSWSDGEPKELDLVGLNIKTIDEARAWITKNNTEQNRYDGLHYILTIE